MAAGTGPQSAPGSVDSGSAADPLLRAFVVDLIGIALVRQRDPEAAAFMLDLWRGAFERHFRGADAGRVIEMVIGRPELKRLLETTAELLALERSLERADDAGAKRILERLAAAITFARAEGSATHAAPEVKQ